MDIVINDYWGVDPYDFFLNQNEVLSDDCLGSLSTYIPFQDNDIIHQEKEIQSPPTFIHINYDDDDSPLNKPICKNSEQTVTNNQDQGPHSLKTRSSLTLNLQDVYNDDSLVSTETTQSVFLSSNDESQEDTVHSEEIDEDWNSHQQVDCLSTTLPINSWTEREIRALKKGVKIYGEDGRWADIARMVKTRNASQCYNKWKNDLACPNKTRWNKAKTAQLREYLQKGYNIDKILLFMPDCTYIQIYQQLQKICANHDPWEPWEFESLIRFMKEGKLSYTKIGHLLNNRHKEDVKKTWNSIRKSYRTAF